jgi:nitrogen regulatory protein PII-like uncharacterized protein
MSKTTQSIRQVIDRDLDLLEMSSFNEGFESAIRAIEEMSNEHHNIGNTVSAEILRKAAKELLGENVDTH